MGALARLLRAALVATVLIFAGMALSIALARLAYPFELEWMEGGSLQQLQRILAGQALYVAPSLDFIPFIYPPLYYYVAAAVAKGLGAGFLPLRLVSLVASLGAAALIVAIVRRETGRWPGALLAAGLFLATYRHSGAWFDVGRVDALYLALFLLAVYLVRFHETWRGWVGAGVAVALAYLTKQLALAMALPVVAWALFRDWRRGLALAGSAALVGGGATLALDAAHGGWYRFYVFETLSRHAIAPEMVIGFWTHDMARALGVAGLAAIAWLVARWRAGDRSGAAFYALTGAAMVGGAYVSRLNFGGYPNVLLWADAWVAVMAGLAFQAAAGAIGALAPDRRAPREAGLYGLALAQFALLAYSPFAQLPTAADAEAGRAVVRRLAEQPGPAWVPYHPYLATMAGHPPAAHGMAMVELLWGHGPVVDGLRRELEGSIAAGRFATIVLDPVWFPPELKSAIEKRYGRSGDLTPAGDVFWPVTGMRTRPGPLYRLAPAGQGSEARSDER